MVLLDQIRLFSRLLEALKQGRYVILLDNLEELLDDQGQLMDEDLQLFFDQSLTGDHGARLLVTSRLSLAFKREVMRFDRQVKLLEGLPVPDGVALLRELDPNGDYGLRDAPTEELARVVSLVHGVPRALEVIAGILANDPFASLTEVIEQFYEQEDVVQALIEENYKRLDDNARRVIEALAVFKRPVPPLAVDYLLEPFVPGLDVPSILRRLTHANIVSIDRAAKTISLHPIDQDYAYSQLPVAGDYSRPAPERRAADYYVQLRTPEETWKTINDLEPQLVEIEHRIRAGDHDGSCRVMKPISDYLYRWGYYIHLAELGEKLLGNLTDPALQASNLSNMGRAYHALGKTQLSIEYYEQALAIARENGIRQIEGNCLSGLSRSYRAVGQVKRAINCLKESLTIARETGDRRQEAGRLGSLGIAYAVLGQIEQALEHYEGALDIVRALDDRQGEGVWLSGVGQAAYNLGQVERGIKLCEEGLAIAREFNNRWIESYSLAFLGDACYAQGQVGQAIEFYKQALQIFREIGNPRGQYQTLLGMSKALLVSKDLDTARQCCMEALALDRSQISYPAELVRGIVLLHQGDSATKATLADAIAHCRTMVDKTPDYYFVHRALATALAGQAVCNPLWIEESKRLDLLTPVLTEYQQALAICAAPGVVQEAVRDLELIQTAGIEGLEPVLVLLTASLEKQTSSIQNEESKKSGE